MNIHSQHDDILLPYFPLDYYDSATQQIELSSTTNEPDTGISRTMDIASGSMTEAIRSDMIEPLRPTTWVPPYTPPTAQCFAGQRNGRVDFVDDLDLSILDNYLDRDTAALPDSRRTTGSQPSGPEWGFDNSELCYPFEIPSNIHGQSDLGSLYNANAMQVASGPSHPPFLSPIGATNQHAIAGSPSTQSPASLVGTIQHVSERGTFAFQCTSSGCNVRPFSRWYDFCRHYNGAHALDKTVFWCPVSDCDRSEGRGNRGFPRRDKMMVHVEKMHGGENIEGYDRSG